MRSLKRKNNALNNAATGLAAGLGQGLQLGMQARRDESARGSAAFQRAQAVQAAQRADRTLQMEEDDRTRAAGLRDANASAAGEMSIGQEPPVDFEHGMAGVASSADRINHEAVQRVKSIAEKMAKMGSPPQQVKVAIDAMKETHKKIDDAGKREMLKNRIARISQDGSMFATQPDGTRVESESVNASLKQATELAGNSNVPVEQLEATITNLKAQGRAEKSRFSRRTSKMAAMDQAIAKLSEHEDGPQTFAQSQASDRQRNFMQGMRDAFDLNQDEIENDPAMARGFWSKWSDVSQGIAGKNPRTEAPYTFAEADTVRESETYISKLAQKIKELEAVNAEKRGGLLDAQTEGQLEKNKTIGPESNARIDKMRQEALAKMVNAKSIEYEKRRGGLTDEKALDIAIKVNPDADSDTLVKKAREFQKKMNGGESDSDPLAGLTDEQRSQIKNAATDEEADALARKFLGK